MGQALTAVRFAGVLEYIFEWGSRPQHEVVFIFTAAFADKTAYDISAADLGCAWQRLGDLVGGRGGQPASVSGRCG